MIGTGAADSQAVVDGFPADDNASSTSLGYAIPGASDWFLPSYDELSLILIRASTDGAAMGTFAATMWSSTQFGSSAARALDFSTGQDLHVTKTTASVGVRPIRAFSAATTTATTTTNASATTTVPESTTTVPESTTTVPESTTTAPESTTTTSTGTATTAVPASITAVVSGAVRTNVALTEATTASSLAGPPTSTTSSAAAPTEAAVLAMQESPLGAPPSPAPGQQVTVSASNFPPFGIGQIYIASTPVLLGTSVADDFGSIAITVVLPSDYTGPHSLVLYQPSTGSGVRQSIVFSSPPVIAYSSATTVANAPSNTVANTTSNTDAYGNVMPASGWDSVDGVMQGLVLVLLGGGCLIAVRRRSDVAS